MVEMGGMKAWGEMTADSGTENHPLGMAILTLPPPGTFFGAPSSIKNEDELCSAID